MKRFLICFSIIVFLYLATTVIGRRNPCSVEPLVLEEIKAIQRAEVLYSVTKGRGRFANLEKLGELQLIDSALASGEKHGYQFEVEVIGATPAMFDLIVKSNADEQAAKGEHSYYSNETMIVYQALGGEPPRAGARNRVPLSGSPVENLPSNSPCLE